MDKGEFTEYFCGDEKNDTDIYGCLPYASGRHSPYIYFLRHGSGQEKRGAGGIRHNSPESIRTMGCSRRRRQIQHQQYPGREKYPVDIMSRLCGIR